MSRITDLTMTLQPGMRGVDITPKCTVAREGWNASTLSLYSHCGTHMDAPVHFAAGPGTIDQTPPEQCMGAAWVVNLAGIQPKAMIEVASLGAVASQFAPGESLLLRTDWNFHRDNPAVYRDGLPRLSDAMAEWCVANRVKMLGVEPPSVADVNNLPEVTRIHKVLLGGGVTIVEGLCNLDQIAAPKVFFVALPLKPLGGDGSPCRALAIEGIPPEGWLTGGGL
jgi:kynurenine formamidase